MSELCASLFQFLSQIHSFFFCFTFLQVFLLLKGVVVNDKFTYILLTNLVGNIKKPEIFIHIITLLLDPLLKRISLEQKFHVCQSDVYSGGSKTNIPSISEDGRLRDESQLSNFSNLTVLTSVTINCIIQVVYIQFSSDFFGFCFNKKILCFSGGFSFRKGE